MRSAGGALPRLAFSPSAGRLTERRPLVVATLVLRAEWFCTHPGSRTFFLAALVFTAGSPAETRGGASVPRIHARHRRYSSRQTGPHDHSRPSRAARDAALVARDVTATAPNQLRVTDLTFVPTWAGVPTSA